MEARRSCAASAGASEFARGGQNRSADRALIECAATGGHVVWQFLRRSLDSPVE